MNEINIFEAKVVVGHDFYEQFNNNKLKNG